MVPKKHKSKRVSASKRYKIDRKVKEHHRKARKNARQTPTKLKKDPGIPNLWPFKDKLLQQIEERKKLKEEEKLRAAEVRKERQGNELASLKRSADQRQRQFERDGGDADGAAGPARGRLHAPDGSRKSFYREFKKVVEEADVVLEVLDARDPLGCRSKQIEEMILNSGGKKVILVLNKIDLVPKENVERWLKYLRNEFPTVAFKASTQTQRTHIGQSAMPVEHASAGALSTSECLGADALIKLLKNYCRNKDIKTSINVGVIGFPNVGKSSLINSLKRSKVCGVGATPGFTKTAQLVQLDKNIKLLDCPGIVFATGASEVDVLLRNCVKVENIEDPAGAVAHLMTRVSDREMMRLYAVPAFGNPTEFLVLLAQLRGKLKKGGIPDLDLVARTVLQDWNGGKIPYFTEPPQETRLLDAAVVAGYSAEFNIDQSFKEAETAELSHLNAGSSTTFVSMGADHVGGRVQKAGGALDVQLDAMETSDEAFDFEEIDAEDDEDDEEADEDEDDDDMDEDEDEEDEEEAPPVVAARPVAKQINLRTPDDALNPQTNRDRKRQAKLASRQRRRSEAASDDADSDEGMDA